MASSRVMLYWLGIVLLLPAAVYALLTFHPSWSVIGVWSMVIVIVPGAIEKNWKRVMPVLLLFAMVVPLILFMSLDLLGSAFSGELLLVTRALAGWIIFFLSLVTVIELRAHTALDMRTGFTILFTVLFSTTVGAVLGVGTFFLDQLLGSTFLVSNSDLMLDLMLVFLISILAGLLTDKYVQRRPLGDLDDHASKKVVIKQ